MHRHTYAHPRMHICTHLCMHTQANTYIQTHTHTLTHKLMHTGNHTLTVVRMSANGHNCSRSTAIKIPKLLLPSRVYLENIVW